MDKSHKIISVAIALLFLIVVQWVSTPAPVFRYLVPTFLLYISAVSVYNFFYLQERPKFNLWTWLLLPLFLIAWFGLFLVLPNAFFRGVFLLVTLPIIFFLEFNMDTVGEHILFNQVLLSAFAFFLSAQAAVHYFVNAPSVVYLLGVFVFISLLVRASLERVPASIRMRWAQSIVLSLWMTQVFWATSFLPLHFSVLGFILLNVFYFIWTLTYHFLLKNLTARKVQFHGVLLVAMAALVLLSTPWSILNS